MREKVNKNFEVPEGKIIDFIDGKLRSNNDFEQIRQNFERTLLEEYQYNRDDISVDFRIKVHDGSRMVSEKVSLVVFHSNKTKISEENILIVIQIAKSNIQPTDSKKGTDDLEKLLIACPNAQFACWTNGIDTFFFQKKQLKFDTDIVTVNDLPKKGEDASSIFITDRSRLRIATGNNLLFAFKRCHNFIHANQGGSKEQIFWEFLKLLFAKIEDEQLEGRPRF
ncbi:MAG TPA: type I restriction enzyme HsdR N-terminal domain-containing protein, partial [Candidatus Glassbacteria bacterium]|nr:type I restriction enzyme HsdR N-terminal domain-containing protein [Candidatus Glassbacteria bacterium]